MSQIAVTQLHQALRKAFQCIENNQKTWRTVLEECAPLMVSLGNLAEQFVALSKVDLSKTPLKVFPDLEEKLRFKLHHATDTVMGKLHEKLSSLQSVRDSISSQVYSVFQIQEQLSQTLDLSVLTERSAAAPSIADMMQWLQDADRHYRQQFIKRKTLLLTLRPDDFFQIESAPERWKSLNYPNKEDKITDMLCKVSFFMESQ
ncbi:hypothetical protein NL108_011470 [Boleophthalmus pectinirostris]|uniref:ribosome biogenesis protein C1orf109 homolog n=1 Tax=Boleophthalmus pectinirostris TaxID=150288 RepID=UPI00242B5004|nr:ribosome biogenesis protein C1orf109 homolog [Boleophthalmus pectinirostris]KAJ0055177.1 hypothetical protein NL108_011470 [Boleophthalmus pectinirostris]